MWIGEAGLYHYKARAYAPSLGRFLQSDPILHAGGMNLYAYVGGDPVNFVDPLGTQRRSDSGKNETITVTGGCLVTDDCATDPLNPFGRPRGPYTQNYNGELSDRLTRLPRLPPNDDGRVWEAAPPEAGDPGFQCPTQEQVDRWKGMIAVGDSMQNAGGLGMVLGLALQADRRPPVAISGRFLATQGAAMASTGGFMSYVGYGALAANGHRQDAINFAAASVIMAGLNLNPAITPTASNALQDTIAHFRSQGGANPDICE